MFYAESFVGADHPVIEQMLVENIFYLIMTVQQLVPLLLLFGMFFFYP